MAALLVLATATPAAATPDGADLTVTVAFDKTEYLAYEEITVSLVITNIGTAPATGVTFDYESTESFGPSGWPPGWAAFYPDTGGVVVEPGQRIELPATFTLVRETGDVLRTTFEVRTQDPETDTTNNTATAEATIVNRTADLVGTLYGDRDGDRQFDQGEALSGVQVRASSGEALARTAADGRFTIPNLPEGHYMLMLGLPAGWQPDESVHVEVRVGGGEVLVRAARDSSALRGTISFDKPAYAVGDTIRERVTLTNTGTTDLAGVTARCVEGAAPNQLSGMGWGDLVHYEKPGVTVRAGETRTFEFTDVVPPGGRLFGFITITCWFGTGFMYYEGPEVMARAEVPGGKGATGGVLYHDRDTDNEPDADEVVAGVKVYLVDSDGEVAGRSVTDERGHFLFADVPANKYYLRLAGRWKLRDDAGLQVGVYDGAVMEGATYAVEPGPTLPDPDAPPPSTVEITRVPDAQASPPPRPAGLADTGTNVVELSVVGVLLLLAGAGLLVVRRSRGVS
jgi:LPXTG-motif cell wall-anchored protein